LPEETSGKAISGEPARSHLWRDASLVLAAATLWLYVMAAMFARGYLRFFNADAHWFDPSVFQLISFCALPVMSASALAGAGVGLTIWKRHLPVDRDSRAWTCCYWLWAVALFATIVLSGSLSSAVFRTGAMANILTLAPTYLAVVLLPLAPGIIAWVTGTFSWRRGLPVVVGMQVLAAVVLAYYLGMAVALVDLIGYSGSRFRAVSEADRSRSVHVLFTDGVRSLSIEGHVGREELHYRNKEAETVLILWWPPQAEVLLRHAASQPAPATQEASQLGL
jgi:hypothetical protein